MLRRQLLFDFQQQYLCTYGAFFDSPFILCTLVPVGTGYALVSKTSYILGVKLADYANAADIVAETAPANISTSTVGEHQILVNVKGKHLSSGNGNWSKFNTTSQAELRTLGKKAIKTLQWDRFIPIQQTHID